MFNVCMYPQAVKAEPMKRFGNVRLTIRVKLSESLFFKSRIESINIKSLIRRAKTVKFRFIYKYIKYI